MALPAVSFSGLATAGSVFTVVRDLQAAGILGWPQMRFALTELAPRVARRVHRRDRSALDEMVSLARSRVPVDTGTLLNGINGSVEGEYFVMRANAVKAEGNADYARFVEFGTAAGSRGRRVESLSRKGFYANAVTGFESGPGEPAPRTRKQYREHPGTDAQPYFYNSAREVMAKRFADFQSIADDTARELDLD